ncbi:hypothetical protein [Clostridium pasteurianum]|uniref:hypothetical protein n=1 Tax=Clostridium pasteurianum TaxID=1501 RepID=UPI00082689F5|nr:hypothetical protein [Clostridium pasteurianum]PJI06907.1 hypothetical protein CUB90_03055 [Clostridium sp. CT7]
MYKNSNEEGAIIIEKRGYSGKYSIVAAFVKKHKQVEIQKATIKFEITPGLQAQVDWKKIFLAFTKKAK